MNSLGQSGSGDVITLFNGLMIRQVGNEKVDQLCYLRNYLNIDAGRFDGFSFRYTA